MIMLCEKHGIVPTPKFRGHGHSLRIVGSHDHTTRRNILAPIFSFAEKAAEAPAQRSTETPSAHRRRKLACKITLVVLALAVLGGAALTFFL